jgi:CPA1 family monovalent cation:H+ antiporter
MDVAAVAESSAIEVTETLIVALLLVAAIVGIVVDRLRVPYTVALVLVGLLLGIGGVFAEIELTDELILLGFLPPLLFEGAINVDLDSLVRRWAQVATLAFVGTAIAALAIAAPLVLVPGMQAELAVVLAVILAATDPVSVLAIFKENGVVAGLRTLMEGESLFNDALAIVLYIIAVEVAFGDEVVTVQSAVFEFGREVSLGIVAGTAVGLLAHRLMATLDDHLVEITLSLVTAYGAYLLADRFGGSGVIAVVAAGLLIGNYGTHFSMSAGSRVALNDFWEVLAFLVNSALFLLIGLQFDIADLLEGRTLAATAVAIVGLLVGRAIIAYGLLLPFTHSEHAPVPASWRPAVFWGGLRGSIPVALVLGLPPDDRTFAGINAVALVFGVVLFSLLVQGLTFRPLLVHLGLTSQTEELMRYERLLARSLALRASRDELERMRRTGAIVPSLHEDLRADIEGHLAETEASLASLADDVETVRDRAVRVTARRLAAVQKATLNEAARSGQISDEIAREMAQDLDEAVRRGRAVDDVDPELFPDEQSAEDPGGTGDDPGLIPDPGSAEEVDGPAEDIDDGAAGTGFSDPADPQ